VVADAAVVLPLPAGATEVTKTHYVTTEIGTLLDSAHRTQRVFQVGVDLHLKKNIYCTVRSFVSTTTVVRTDLRLEFCFLGELSLISVNGNVFNLFPIWSISNEHLSDVSKYRFISKSSSFSCRSEFKKNAKP
jgi:hypothetical protein